MKILYMTHISWEWIFQRPQILALLLEKDFECTVVNRKWMFRSTVVKNNRVPRRMRVVNLLPKSGTYKFMWKLNCLLYKKVIRDYQNFDVIWLCHPELYDYIPKDYRGKIVYDCMDNYVELAVEHRKSFIKTIEQDLIKRADLIFASSKKLIEAVPNLNTAVLIRNGFSNNGIMSIKDACFRDNYHIGYIGTLSSWFDYKLLLDSSKRHKNVTYHLIGPKEKRFLDDESEKILYEGIIEHSKLYESIKDYDALIMPFEINDIILSVDPVKLYEYICFGKCIISVYYPEIERFSPFVYFYKDLEEYEELLSYLSKNGFKPKYNKKQQEEFLEQNTWECRYDIIKSKLLELKAVF